MINSSLVLLCQSAEVKHVSNENAEAGRELTLVFYNVFPLISNALGSFLGWFGGEDH